MKQIYPGKRIKNKRRHIIKTCEIYQHRVEELFAELLALPLDSSFTVKQPIKKTIETTINCLKKWVGKMSFDFVSGFTEKDIARWEKALKMLNKEKKRVYLQVNGEQTHRGPIIRVGLLSAHNRKDDY